ncbi:MAG: FIST C-terminal domain-containing protein, partial [Phycisphaerae bacterium]|nr:FIST C-terminal domain-containing protein [Gemmatimonadaceae bacterium]
GLAADGDRFEHTYVGLGTSVAEKQVVAVALYGSALRVGFGSAGGWSAFGPERLVTASSGNVLRTLDAEPALALYKRYLGDASGDLPASALLFPLALNRVDSSAPVVRTILAVDEALGTLTFAADIPEGARVRLMRASINSLVGGAEGAARMALDRLGRAPSVAILVSCVGRRLVLKQRVEDELDGVRQILGNASVMAGLYSYGEITPLAPSCCSELHNQTMTVTLFSEC